MSDEDAHKTLEGSGSQTLRTVIYSFRERIDTDAALRMAHAFEYIAAQLGEINRKLSTLTR